jgi:hypothetical protein
LRGGTLRAFARVENGGSAPAQVDRASFHAAVHGVDAAAVDNDTGRPLLDWVPGMFYCLRDLAGVAAFPDHVFLGPGEGVEGELCWIVPRNGAYRPIDAATIAYADLFSTSVHPAEAFMGVFLPRDAGPADVAP